MLIGTEPKLQGILYINGRRKNVLTVCFTVLLPSPLDEIKLPQVPSHSKCGTPQYPRFSVAVSVARHNTRGPVLQ